MSTTHTTNDLNLVPKFTTMADARREERKLRIENSKNVLSFGVSFLDDALHGIYPDDLIVLGAKSGMGKTQLATHIALTNSSAGKRVHYFALEADQYEIQRRCKYQMLYRYIKDNNIYIPGMSYSNWYYGKLDQELSDVEEAIDALPSPLDALNVFYRENEFTAETFEKIFLYVKDKTDLVIIDHLHYFDFEDANENRAIKNTIKKIRDCAQLSHKPVILVAHVRKSDKRSKQIIPDIEDFHGSSDIGKIGTKVFTIAGVPGQSGDPGVKETYFQVNKARVDGSLISCTGMVPFRLSEQNYGRHYVVGKMNFEGNEFTASSGELIPRWARRNAIDAASSATTPYPDAPKSIKAPFPSV